MLITILILIAICCTFLIVLLLQLQKNQKGNLALFNEIKKKLDSIEQLIPIQVNEWTTEFSTISSDHYQKMLDTQTNANKVLLNQVIKKLMITKDDISDQLKNELHTYIHYDDFQQNEWLQLIQNQTNQRTKLQYLESALNKFPNNRSFFESYLQLLNETLVNATLRPKQTIIEKMNHSCRIFFDNCKVEDAHYAQQVKDEAIRLGHKFMKDMDQLQKEQFTTLINKLEKLVLSGKGNLVEIENIDTQINVALLKNYPELLEKYQQITAKLTTNLMKKPSEEEIKSYNLRAVESLKSAQSYFKNNEASVKKGYLLEDIINYLGGWDTQYLSPPTQIYYQNIYSDIFSKLDADVKPEMTKQILNAHTKGV